MTTRRNEKPMARAPREVSARQALSTPLKYHSQSVLKSTAKKLQRIGKAKGPNDPGLT